MTCRCGTSWRDDALLPYARRTDERGKQKFRGFAQPLGGSGQREQSAMFSLPSFSVLEYCRCNRVRLNNGWVMRVHMVILTMSRILVFQFDNV